MPCRAFALRADWSTPATLNISAHESDNRFYECAEVSGADYLITGNTDDFPKEHGPTKIITPRDFLDGVVPRLLGGEL
jgi:predicted nucleic acid-binding protein